MTYEELNRASREESLRYLTASRQTLQVPPRRLLACNTAVQGDPDTAPWCVSECAHLSLTGQVVVTDHHSIRGSEASAHLRVAVFYLDEVPFHCAACL